MKNHWKKNINELVEKMGFFQESIGNLLIYLNHQIKNINFMAALDEKLLNYEMITKKNVHMDKNLN